MQPSQQELDDLRHWIIRNVPFGFIFGHNFSAVGTYRGTQEYHDWIQSNDYAMKYQVAQLKPGVEEKAAKAMAGKAAEAEAPASELSDLLGGGISNYKTISEGGWDYLVGYDKDGNVVSREPLGRTSAQTSYQQPGGSTPTDPYGRTATWDADNAEWRYPPDWGTDPAKQAGGYMSPYEQWQQQYQESQASASQRQFDLQLQLQREQMQQESQQQSDLLNWYRQQQEQQLAAQREQQLAELRANPASWLEYASLAGETPAVQPWMLPLASEEYGFEVGAPLPGWNPSGESLGGLPQLYTPSTQYMARTTPSAQQQYAGYEQARTGATPEDVDWRLWSQAPPGGGSGSRPLSYRR